MAAFDDQSGITPEAIPDIAALFRSKPILFVREGEAAGSSASSANAEEDGRGLGMSFQGLVSHTG